MKYLNENNYVDFGQRLKQIIGNERIEDFSKRSTISKTTIHNYLNGSSSPTLERLYLIAKAADVDVSWLATGNDYQTPSSNNSDYIKIPHFDVQASAGTGSELVESGISKNTVDIHPQTLLDQGLNPEGLLSMYVKGDSMEPSLFDGDMILVKKMICPFSILEGVYIFRVFNEIFIKRIQFNKYSAKLKVDSDNPFYDSYTITGNNLNDVEIIGEVICTIFSKVRRISRPTSEESVAVN
ncbi:XRE family transcriptional regulator [Moritella viscosa]|uniref:XRE family transcriptional regulator n=1 Tax=Moritella viscosa TaxID=80854 RepID=UPI0009221695|nr:LexA family transcriptional regulator [Moritella viscosa]SHO14286.1 Transcriptional activator-regulatory protein (Phage-related repressor protein) [Moritella viscosa]SHO16127.1 Transcriptional activator-regulatory protein (Phage-related repressor protein) [Moritella viscosa]SHO18955.1 Transcriptional activator-regulatory protein (Phage-related repressor protein) [Moritella viscosa]